MKIDEQLHLTMTVDSDDGSVIHVHAAPVSREVFQRYWRPMSRAYEEILDQKLVVTGPRIAANALRDAARELGILDGPTGVDAGLMPEIRRLTNVLVAGTNGHAGWQPIPYDDALRADLLTQDEADEIEGILVFFTLAWRQHRKADRRDWIIGVSAVWGALTSSLNLSAFANSLPTSIATGSIGATPPAVFSPPSSIGLPMTGFTASLLTEATTSPGIARASSVSAT